jgi:DNA-binding transcriptional regulator YhcF (GntR family)
VLTVPLLLTLTDGTSPADQVRDQIHGLIATGRLAAGERLPSVSQLAHDLGIAPGTIAKAFRALEADGLLESRIGSGTRVSRTAGATTQNVLEHARALAAAGIAEGLDIEDVVRVLRAVWTDHAGDVRT